MQQSLNFRQLFDTLAGPHGERVWENAFDANTARSSVGFSERRFQLRNELNVHIIEQRVRSSPCLSCTAHACTGAVQHASWALTPLTSCNRRLHTTMQHVCATWITIENALV